MAATMVASLSSHAIGSMPRGIIIGGAPALPSIYSLQQSRRRPAAGRSLTVCCQAEEKPRDVERRPPINSPKSPAITPIPQAQPRVKSASFWDLMAFEGPAPERINGRLAMVGFVSAIAVELGRGQDLATQISDGGVLWFAGTAALLSAASLIPLFRGVDATERSNGVMTADAELWNGRFAMLGLVGLAFTEFVIGGPLFRPTFL
ncbi:hypothetical protein KSP40_PGU004343 [Platanthera guangdongensis]|uniref:Uncharacterized protein n=1 Tax=Platanthera guangdongensis TaxID=2320717 RepID=A0ABR2MGC7_9ASPA